MEYDDCYLRERSDMQRVADEIAELREAIESMKVLQVGQYSFTEQVGDCSRTWSFGTKKEMLAFVGHREWEQSRSKENGWVEL